ncbi:hypothetical protein [Streptosporangium sandarakinum]|uniref:Uncharacterized protein n=1 Tax=Streptosporangium sandarakinum TaxID=1260955 RepID=A0A852V407_9ACTN|nr:hypothetical protein [Streptosporangium sandarakinum]NYF44557.1 hypothetical protein [Streptosporangium sandarakinum]
MLRRLLVSAALAGSVLVVPAAALPASATAAQAPAAAASLSACTYRRDGNVWRCITPGAFCPSAARNRYGYAKVTNRRYKCLKVSGDTRWRWKRA